MAVMAYHGADDRRGFANDDLFIPKPVRSDSRKAAGSRNHRTHAVILYWNDNNLHPADERVWLVVNGNVNQTCNARSRRTASHRVSPGSNGARGTSIMSSRVSDSIDKFRPGHSTPPHAVS